MKYVVTQNQFHNLVYGYINKLVKSAQVVREDNYYVEGGYGIVVSEGGQSIFSYDFTPEGESWDDPTDKIYPENGSLSIKKGIVDDMSELFGLRKSKIFDLIADWFTDTYEVNVDDVYDS